MSRHSFWATVEALRGKSESAGGEFSGHSENCLTI
jgi:hypothetical protein